MSRALAPLARAEQAWGHPLPDEVRALAEEAARTTGAAVAARIGYSPAVVSNVLANRYPGDMPTVLERIRGALLGDAVECPVLGPIGRHTCLDEQKAPFSATSSVRSRLYRACRSGCPHSRLTAEAERG